MTKEISLTQGKFAIVDDDDYGYLNQWRWHASKQRNSFYAQRTSKPINGERAITIYMHIEIIGRKEGFEIDHINGEGLDNRRENIRHVTHRQNLQNRHDETSSEYPGVYWYKRDRKWRAMIWLNGKKRHLGCFTNEQEAFTAYCKAAGEM
jgi:hypothetical protein